MEDVEPTKSAITFTVLLIGWLVQCCHQRRGTASVGSYNSTILVEDFFSNLVNECGTQAVFRSITELDSMSNQIKEGCLT